MFKQSLTLFSIVCLAAQAHADCQDITLDSCVGDPPFQTLKLASEENCQQYCSQVFPDVCTFFIYDRQQDICQLFDYDPQAYADSCALIAATPTPSLAECRASDEECLKFSEGYCKYNGDLLENLQNITSATACQFACLIYDKLPTCNYFFYNGAEENCQFLSSTSRTCDLIRGPPTPSLTECSDKPTPPTTPKTTTTPQKRCPETWLHSDQGCFYFAEEVEAMTWYEARDYCESLDAYLAEVPNAETQNILASHAATLSPANWWLGATDEENEGMWLWIRSGMEVVFTAWGSGEPNNRNGVENCLHLYSNSGYQWNDTPCTPHADFSLKPLCQNF